MDCTKPLFADVNNLGVKKTNEKEFFRHACTFKCWKQDLWKGSSN